VCQTAASHSLLFWLADVYVGGRGKSTMAKILYNRLKGGFPHSAFVEIQVDDGADKTAQHLSSALKGLGAKGKASEGEAALSAKLKSFVKGKKVLLVVDNVWMARQLDALLPVQWGEGMPVQWGEGSKVIVTSRFQSFQSNFWPQVRAVLGLDECMSTWLGLLMGCFGSHIQLMHASA
jgi:hypothetical protein